MEQVILALLFFYLTTLFLTVGLQSAFRTFGPMKIEWPGKDGKHPRYPTKGKELPGEGYCHFLLSNCHLNLSYLYYKLTVFTLRINDSVDILFIIIFKFVRMYIKFIFL